MGATFRIKRFSIEEGKPSFKPGAVGTVVGHTAAGAATHGAAMGLLLAIAFPLFVMALIFGVKSKELIKAGVELMGISIGVGGILGLFSGIYTACKKDTRVRKAQGLDMDEILAVLKARIDNAKASTKYDNLDEALINELRISKSQLSNLTVDKKPEQSQVSMACKGGNVLMYIQNPDARVLRSCNMALDEFCITYGTDYKAGKLKQGYLVALTVTSINDICELIFNLMGSDIKVNCLTKNTLNV